MRDSHIQILGLESAQFPHATFALSSPVTLPANATSGAEIALSLHGALTIHGTTRTVTIPVRARLSGSEIEVVGSITFPWGEFNMQAPNIGGFVTVNSAATMEFDLFLQAQLTASRAARQRREARTWRRSASVGQPETARRACGITDGGMASPRMIGYPQSSSSIISGTRSAHTP